MACYNKIVFFSFLLLILSPNFISLILSNSDGVRVKNLRTNANEEVEVPVVKQRSLGSVQDFGDKTLKQVKNTETGVETHNTDQDPSKEFEVESSANSGIKPTHEESVARKLYDSNNPWSRYNFGESPHECRFVRSRIDGDPHGPTGGRAGSPPKDVKVAVAVRNKPDETDPVKRMQDILSKIN